MRLYAYQVDTAKNSFVSVRVGSDEREEMLSNGILMGFPYVETREQAQKLKEEMKSVILILDKFMRALP